MAHPLTPTHAQIAEHLIDVIISDMTQFLIDDYGLSLEQALDTIYTSKMLTLLTNEESGLYIQSPSYNYEILLQEKGLQ